MLRNLVINKILLDIDKGGKNVVTYADMVVLVVLVRGIFVLTISEIMEILLRRQSKYATERGLGDKPRKTKLKIHN